MKPTSRRWQQAQILSWVAVLFALLLAGDASAAQPGITITSLPAYGASGVMQGLVSGVDFSAYRVAGYIQIEGAGWWTKPTYASPTVPINSDGTFSANVVSGGLDNRATIFCAALVPTGYTPPQAGGSPRVPATLAAVAIDSKERYGPTVSFAGLTWAMKDGPAPVGPNGNYFSTLPSDIWVDAAGLHLTIHQHDGVWWATEVILPDSLGYGTYTVQTNSRTDNLDVNATFAPGFTWDAYGDDTSGDSHNRELDIAEDSRWHIPTDPNTQAVIQPYDVPGNRHRFNLPDLSGNPALTRIMIWRAASIRFITLQGHYSPANYPQQAVIDDWTYQHDPASLHYIPPPGRQRIHMNLWINNNALANGQPVEALISGFSFIPDPALTLRIQPVSGQAGQKALLFGPVLTGYNHTVQTTPDLSAGSWTTLPNTSQSDNGQGRTVIDLDATGAKKFYRIFRGY